MVVLREPKTFYFDFDWPKNADENLRYQNKFIIKSNESLAENNIKNQNWITTAQIKPGNDIHEHEKQQNKWTT